MVSELGYKRRVWWGTILPCQPFMHSSRLRHRNEIPVTVSPSESTLTNLDAHKFFRICSYEKCRVSLAISPALGRSDLRTFQHVFHLSPLFSQSCALFCATGAMQLFWNQFVAQSFHHHGGVYPLSSRFSSSHTPFHRTAGCAKLAKFRRGLRFTVSLRTGGYFPRPCHAQFPVRGRIGRVKVRRETAAFLRNRSAAKNFPSMTPGGSGSRETNEDVSCPGIQNGPR
jgi:hypothetical protein